MMVATPMFLAVSFATIMFTGIVGLIIITRFILERGKCNIIVAKGDTVVKVSTNMPSTLSDDGPRREFEASLISKIGLLIEDLEKEE